MGIDEIVETNGRAIVSSTRHSDAERLGDRAMPLAIVTVEHAVAINDERYAGATRPTTTEQTLARHHDECCCASTNECWPFRRAALPTVEEIRYASELRLRLRDRYLSRPEPGATPWCVGAD